jgi:hypothetical protein
MMHLQNDEQHGFFNIKAVGVKSSLITVFISKQSYVGTNWVQNCAILCLDRIKKEAEAMDVTLTGNLQSVLWDHIRELYKPKYQQPIQPAQQGFRRWGN